MWTSLVISVVSLLLCTCRVEAGRRETNDKAARDPLDALDQDFLDMARRSRFNADELLDKNGVPVSHSRVRSYLELLVRLQQRNIPATPLAVPSRAGELQESLDCTGTFWSGRRAKPAKIVHLLHMAFEIDLLEVVLHELHETVDEFVIYEGTYTQRGGPKPTIFANYARRFEPFLPKIRHYIQTEEEAAFNHSDEFTSGMVWVNEMIPRDMGYKRYAQEVQMRGESLDNTLFLTGDLDELPPAEAVYRFKHCATENFPAAFYTVMYGYDMEHVHVLTDGCGPFGCGYWTQPTMIKAGGPLRHSREHMYPEMVGAHLHPRDPMATLAKLLMAAEGGRLPVQNSNELLAPYHLQRRIACDTDRPAKRVDEWKSKQWVPWLLTFNHSRFPYMWPSEFPSYACTVVGTRPDQAEM